MHFNLESLEKMCVKQACCTCLMTFEIQALTVLIITDGTFVKLFGNKILGSPPHIFTLHKSYISKIGQFCGLLVPEVFNFTLARY